MKSIIRQLIVLLRVLTPTVLFSRFSLFFAGVMFISSCWNSPYKGYTSTSTGLYYKLLMIGDGKNIPKEGDFLQLIITYKTINDSVFYDTYSSNRTGKVILPFARSSFKGSFEEGLTRMNAGDSVSFIVDADSLFGKFFKAPLPIFLEKNRLVKMDVKLHDILNREEYMDVLKNYKKMMEDRDLEELRTLSIYLDTCQYGYSTITNGIYYYPIKQGAGEYTQMGDAVKIHYKGYFLNGKPFESTYDRKEPLEFRFGDEGQVIPGFKSALKQMNEGAVLRVVIPSNMAFGPEGSGNSIVPPYTTVIYEIELLSLIKPGTTDTTQTVVDLN